MRVLVNTDTLWISKQSIILTCRFKKAHLDLEGARLLVKHRLNIVSQSEFPTLYDLSSLQSVSKEARDYLSSAEAHDGIRALALLHNTPLSRIIAGVFSGVARTHFPTRLFEDPQTAMEWLQTKVDLDRTVSR